VFILYLCMYPRYRVNDLPEAVSSEVRLFADDCLLYRVIKSINDHLLLQQYLKALEKWALENGMSFNAKKCYILSIRNKSTHFYQLNDTILQEVPHNPYLGVMISNDLKWNTHINNVCKKASSTLGFVRRNVQHCPAQTRRVAYLALVRSIAWIRSINWDPYTTAEIEKLEKVQRRAAHFISKDYKSRQPGCVTKMLEEHNLPPLQQRRKEIRLALFYKVANGSLPGLPTADYLTPTRNKRKIKAKRFDDCVTKNIVDHHENRHSRCFQVPRAQSDVYKNSFFVKTTSEWNSLEEEQVNCSTLDSFKASLQKQGRV